MHFNGPSEGLRFQSHNRGFVSALALIVCVVFELAGSGTSRAQDFEIAKGLKGTIKGRLYTSPGKDYEIRIPPFTGGHARDEVGREGSISASQAIFTSDFGAFYRVVSFRPSNELTTDYVVANVFHDVRDKKAVQSPSGREWRVIDVEKQGSEIVVTDSKGKQQKPDLLTASAVFVANGRIYQVTAGLALGLRMLLEGERTTEKAEEQFEDVRKRLDEFLKGFKRL